MKPIILYGTPGSPYVRSVRLGLAEKSAPHSLVPVQLGEHNRGDHLKRHPFGRVPAIEHDGFWLYETQAILRYLDDLIADPPIAPVDPKTKARMNQLAGIVDWYFFHQITATITWQRIVVPIIRGTPDESIIAQSVPKAEICITEIARLMSGPFLVGERPSIADLMLAPHLNSFAATPEGRELLSRNEKLSGWLGRMRERESMRTSARRVGASDQPLG